MIAVADEQTNEEKRKTEQKYREAARGAAGKARCSELGTTTLSSRQARGEANGQGGTETTRQFMRFPLGPTVLALNCTRVASVRVDGEWSEGDD